MVIFLVESYFFFLAEISVYKLRMKIVDTYICTFPLLSIKVTYIFVSTMTHESVIQKILKSHCNDARSSKYKRVYATMSQRSRKYRESRLFLLEKFSNSRRFYRFYAVLFSFGRRNVLLLFPLAFSVLLLYATVQNVRSIYDVSTYTSKICLSVRYFRERNIYCLCNYDIKY